MNEVKILPLECHMRHVAVNTGFVRRAGYQDTGCCQLFGAENNRRPPLPHIFDAEVIEFLCNCECSQTRQHVFVGK